MIKRRSSSKLENRQQLYLTDILTGGSIIALKFSSFDSADAYEINTHSI